MSKTSVLVIDDDASIHTIVKSRLEGVVDSIVCVNRPAAGIRDAILERPNVILLDINMPEMDGFKVCSHLKENAATRDIPILFLTVDRNVEHLAKALDCGGSDYILKPFNEVELEARVRAALRTSQMFEMLREQARIDALTGLSNRAAMDDALSAAIASHNRNGQHVALLMIDLDHFKQVNDTHGHGVGDDVLRDVGAALRNRCRPYDIACRFGGDEFAIILSHVDGDTARQAAARILTGISEVAIRLDGKVLKVSSSAGLATTSEMGTCSDPETLLQAADSALYRAKKGGRRRMVVATGR